MKVGILTMFNGLATIYSLVNVVAEHIRMLLDNGIEVKLLVCEELDYNEKAGIYLDPRIEWVKVCNRYKGKQIHWRDYNSPSVLIHNTLHSEAKVVGKDLVNKLEDVDICMMHDIHYQGWHLIHNLAVRYAGKKLPNLKFIAMTHSMPDESQINNKVEWPHSARYSPMDNTTYVYPTACGLNALARQYNVDISRCRVINNTIDIIGNMCEEVKDLHNKIDLLSPEILIIYPARFTTGKKFEKVAFFAGILKRISSYQVKIIFCDFIAMDTKEEEYKKSIRKVGIESGLDLKDMVFVSDHGYKMGLSREAIFELFTLSNLFICPSYAESFGLTVLEAASRGNFIVLNEAVPALEELGKNLNAYFLRWDARNFGFTTMETYHPSEELYYEEHGRIILNLMENNSVIQAKMKSRIRYSPKWVYDNQLSPLLINE